MQFLVRTVSELPGDYPEDAREALVARERRRSSELSDAGKLVSHWQVPVVGESITVWDVSGPEELHEILMSLPAAGWARSSATPLIERHLRQHAAPDEHKGS